MLLVAIVASDEQIECEENVCDGMTKCLNEWSEMKTKLLMSLGRISKKS